MGDTSPIRLNKTTEGIRRQFTGDLYCVTDENEMLFFFINNESQKPKLRFHSFIFVCPHLEFSSDIHNKTLIHRNWSIVSAVSRTRPCSINSQMIFMLLWFMICHFVMTTVTRWRLFGCVIIVMRACWRLGTCARSSRTRDHQPIYLSTWFFRVCIPTSHVKIFHTIFSIQCVCVTNPLETNE